MAQNSGLKRWQERMEAIPKEVRKAVQPALEKSAEEMASSMRTLAPEDEGDLIASIEVTKAGHATPPYSQPGGSHVVPESAVAITAGNTDVRYAHLVEYGHGSGFNGSQVPPHPFFWPAYRLNKTRAQRRIKRAISKAVKDHWGKGS